MSKRSFVVLAALAVVAVAVPAFAGGAPKTGPDLRRDWKYGAPEFFGCESPGGAASMLAAQPSATFCDGSAHAGTSKSCKAWGKANPAVPSISCPAGSSIANLNCNPYENKQCASGYGCDCTWDCRRGTIAEPVDPVELSTQF